VGLVGYRTSGIKIYAMHARESENIDRNIGTNVQIGFVWLGLWLGIGLGLGLYAGVPAQR